MSTCKNCGKPLSETAKFCTECGTKVEEIAAAAQVETEVATEPVAEPAPETPVAEEIVAEEIVAEPAPEETPAEPETPAAPIIYEDIKSNSTKELPLDEVVAEPAEQPDKKGKKPKKKKKKGCAIVLILGFLTAALAVLLAVVIFVVSLFIPSKEPNYLLYLKDNELFYTEMPKTDPLQITENLNSGEYEINQWAMGRSVFLSNDGEKIFYIDRFEDEYVTVYYRNLKDVEEDPIKIDSDITNFKVSEKGDYITYLKGQERILYQHNLKDKEKIDTNVDHFVVSKNGKNMFYTKEAGEHLFFKERGSEKEKVDTHIHMVWDINEDATCAYYEKDDKLYRKEAGKEKEKLLSEFATLEFVGEKGAFYYTTTEDVEVNLKDYLDDDLYNADKKTKEPVYPNYPTYTGDLDAYWDALDRYYDKVEQYYEEYEAYLQKAERDAIRKELENYTCTVENRILWYHNGEKSTKITENYGWSIIANNENNVFAYNTYRTSDKKTVKMSEINSIYDLEYAVEENLYTERDFFVAKKETAHKIKTDSAYAFDLSTNGKKLFFLDNYNETANTGDLYTVDISGNNIKDPIIYEREVYTYELGEKDLVLTFKDVDVENANYSKGDLYVNGELLDYEVSIYTIVFIEGSEKFLYYTDPTDQSATLKLYSKGEKYKISDEVYDFAVTPDGDIAYLCEYNTTYQRGELKLYKEKKKESVQIDDDVTAIVPFLDYDVKGTPNYY